MNSIDIAIIIIILSSSTLGIYWGLIRQVLSTAGLIAGIVLASRYGSNVADTLSSFVQNDIITQVLGFLFVMVAVSGLSSLLASLLHRFVGLLFLGWLDHLAGGILGFAQAALACAVLITVGAAVPEQNWLDTLNDSQIAPVLLSAFGGILDLLPASFQFATQIVFGLT
ncbi:MAG: CvpA family protein [Chloroflexi bacterium AL-W]|nr:CvpA family protein [Chloroflexi bacterium AL-N1]NOK70227.1 CvpA family protein [Chloroflexi bacterium AL-N10]NOK77764.1 CvpA family protein [Chloroflexi bacterium AL-N5]NOK84773.1 CvpA family protein [Chloroflexi bacterium AL-W]NOK92380.1 CvpA family protein [Chloroflexi bacterium AL-N15]